MNILFVTTYEISEQKGGTERTTARVSDALREKGYRCYNLYDKVIDPSLERTRFDGVFNNVSKDHVKEIVEKYHIDRILFEGSFALVKEVYNGVQISNVKPQLIFVHHFAPGFEPYFNAFYSLRKSFVNALNLNYRLKALVKILAFPFYKPYMDSKFPVYYQETYRMCDKVVLLSANYIDAYCKYGGIVDKKKFRAINNALSFDEDYPESELAHKEKSVLVVSRFDEIQKRISLVLKIWQKVEADPDLNSWTLKLVGYGDSEPDYRKLVKDLGLARVRFEGRQDPRPYYKKSSLFMMTSLFEGWPMTINESLQYGCVPFAFDSCAAMSDIIEDGKNGCLVRDVQLDEYYMRMRELMTNEAMLTQFQQSAIKRSKDFSLDIIINKWIKLLEEL